MTTMLGWGVLLLWFSACETAGECQWFTDPEFEFTTEDSSVACTCLGPNAARCIAYEVDGVCTAQRDCVVFEDGGFDVNGNPISAEGFAGLVEACATDAGDGPTEMETWDANWCATFVNSDAP